MIVRQVSPWSLGWNPPSAAFAQMRRDMENLMERLTGAGNGGAGGVFPPMNISEDRDHYYVRALVPGIDPAELDVSVVHQTVTVSGTRQAPEEAGASYHRRERAEGAFSRSVTVPAAFEGAFSRSVTVPAAFEGGRVDAKYMDGILTLTLPKPEAAKPRRVTVQTR